MAIRRFIQTIDTLNDWAGRLFSYLLIPLAGITFLEVTLRYVFDRPTIWAWDVNMQLFAAICLFGGGTPC